MTVHVTVKSVTGWATNDKGENYAPSIPFCRQYAITNGIDSESEAREYIFNLILKTFNQEPLLKHLNWAETVTFSDNGTASEWVCDQDYPQGYFIEPTPRGRFIEK